MAAIGSIRKHGVLLMIIIGFALVLFLLTGLFDGNAINRFLYADQYTRGKVDGEYIDDRYMKVNEELTTLYKILNDKTTLEEREIYFIHELAWEQVVTEITIGKEFESLGIVYTDEVIEGVIDAAYATLSTSQPNSYLMGFFNYLAKLNGVEWAQQVLLAVRDAKDQPENAELYGMYSVIENRIVFENKLNTYRGFAAGTVNFSDESARKIAQDNKIMTTQLLTINPQHNAFAEIDATVSDSEMKKFYDENKIRYKNETSLRDIDLALFPILPTVTDKKNIEDEVRARFERLQATTLDTFNRNEMFSPVDSGFHKAGANLVVNTNSGFISLPTIDTLDKIIFNTPVGGYIEPFNYEDNIWFYGQTIGAAQHPDSVLVAFLVLDYRSSQNPNGTRTKKQARLESDSLKNLIETQQATIFELFPNYSGNMTDTTLWLEEERTMRTLYNHLLETPNGGLYVENGQSAFVIYQVLTKTAPVAKRQYALYAAEIQASEETINNLRAQANKLAASSSTNEEFLAEANNAGAQVLNGRSITPMASDISQFDGCRAVVAWAFDDNIAKGAVSDVFKLDNGYFVVASVANVLPQGIPAFEQLKSMISDEMSYDKKIELVREKVAAELAAGKSMKDVASQYGAMVMDSSKLTYMGEQGQNRGVDNGSVGVMFAKSSTSGIQTIAGKSSVFVFSAGSVVDGAQPSETLQQEKFLLRNICLGRARNEFTILNGLKRNIEIKDNRARFYR